MKILKSFCSLALVAIVLFCIGLCAFAYSNDTFSIDIPYDFTKVELSKNNIYWENIDGTVSILAMVSEEDNNINPDDITDSQLKKFENVFREDIEAQFAADNINILSVSSSIVDLGEHSAIRLYVLSDKLGDEFYMYAYVFNTKNYTHQFIIYSEEKAADFADDLMKNVKIYDKPAGSALNLLGNIPIIIGVILIIGIVIITVIRVKRNGGRDNLTKWLYIACGVIVIINILIKLVFI